jgi:hypothetical protein
VGRLKTTQERIAKRLKNVAAAKEKAKKDYEERAKQKILASKFVENVIKREKSRQKIG